MNIGIFGGTFDPIHNGHILLAESFLEQLSLDEVWFLVTPQNPWKQDSVLSDDHFRLEMVRKALAGHPGLVASDYEFRLAKPSYSFQTLRHLRADFPDREFTLLSGADNWVKFDRWAEPDEILRHHRIAVYPRRGYHVDVNALPPNVSFVNTQLYDISSTAIRRLLHDGGDASEFLPEEILPLVKDKY